MNYAYVDCLLTDEEILNMTCSDHPQDSVSFFSGNISDIDEVRNTIFNRVINTLCHKEHFIK